MLVNAFKLLEIRLTYIYIYFNEYNKVERPIIYKCSMMKGCW